MAKGDRSVAISDINDIAQALERYYSYNRVYPNDFGDISMGSNGTYSISDSGGLYNYTIGVPNTTTPASVPQTSDQYGQDYVIYATPADSRDTWILSQNEHSFQQHYASASTTAITGWP